MDTKKSTKDNKENSIEHLIISGINITRRADKSVIHHTDELDVLFKSYIFWLNDTKSFFQKNKIKNDLIAIFYEGDNVPKFKSGAEYGDINSNKSQKLIDDIRDETKNKLEYLKKISTDLPIKNKLIKSNEIQAITCAKSEKTSKYFIIVNNDYRNPLKVDGNKKCWHFLLKMAEKNNYLPINENKSNFDYFNTNRRNRIYTKTGYKLTNIFRIESNYIYPNIKIEIISEKSFKTRNNKIKPA